MSGHAGEVRFMQAPLVGLTPLRNLQAITYFPFSLSQLNCRRESFWGLQVVHEEPMRHHKLKASLTTLRCLLGCISLFAAGCGPSGSSPQQGGSDPVANQSYGTGSSQRQRQAEFLNRIRQSDPQYQTIQKAVL